jgi:hypothetical protein
LLPSLEILFEQGLKPATPQNEAGILIEPPISFPIPTGEHKVLTNPASPPLDPPAFLELSYGLRAYPQIKLLDSIVYDS